MKYYTSIIYFEANLEEKCELITINPKFLIVLLQKEQSLISDDSPTQRQLDWATGYGCPDNQDCNTRWKGFGKQVNSAALQFYDYMVHPQYYTYKAGNTYTLTNTNKDDMVVTPLNQATAALYNYTPHVYNGNYNFFKLWHKYFTRKYPNGSLLQAHGDEAVYLIQNDRKRAFMSKGALSSRYDPNRIIMVNQSDLEVYKNGVPIKFPEYSLLRSPDDVVFLLVNDKKRRFENQEALRMVGINPEEIVDVTLEDLRYYREGMLITASSSNTTGALLQNKITGGVFWATDRTKAPLIDAFFLKTKFKNRPIIPTDPEDLNKLERVEPIIFEDGYLISPEDASSVYIIENRLLRPITSADVFLGLGYKWENIMSVPRSILSLYTYGKPIDEIFINDED